LVHDSQRQKNIMDIAIKHIIYLNLDSNYMEVLSFRGSMDERESNS
jgi:hypothetical protein